MESCSPNSSLILQQKEEESMSSITRKIPEDVYHEILSRLPVKSIKNCKYVCKSWLSIISNPNFVKLHFQRNKNNLSLLLGMGDHMNPISYDLLESSLSIEKIEVCAVGLRMFYPPLNPGIDAVRFFGSCNGLLFLGCYNNFQRTTDYYDEYEYPGIDGSLSDDDDYPYPDTDGSSTYDFDDFESDNSPTDGYGRGRRKDQSLFVWNPATDEYKEIIPHSSDIKIKKIRISGLRYDGKNDDYKFVIGGWPNGSGLATLLEIFSLRSNSWQTMETPYDFNYEDVWCWKPGVLVNGDLHWLAKGDCGLCIVYLDFCNDTPSFKEFQLPTVLPNLEFVSVGELEEGCLCVVGHDRDPASLSRVQVWEMKVYGVHESWTRRYVFMNDTISRSIMDEFSGRRPIWSFKNGKIVFLDQRAVVLYDPKHGTAKERELETLAYFESGANYVESLVSLDSGTYAGTERMKESAKRKANDNVIFSCFNKTV